MEKKSVVATEFRMNVDRVGKAALLLAMSSDEEEVELKKKLSELNKYKIGVTRVAGFASDIRKS